VAFNEPINIIVPIIQARTGRSAQFDFQVRKHGDYQFALLLSADHVRKNQAEWQRQLKLFGNSEEQGEAIPVSLRVIEDGKLFFEGELATMGTVREYDFYRGNDIKVVAMVRNVKIINLPPGHYSAEITLLKDMPDFDSAEIYAQLIHFSSRSLLLSKIKTLAMDRKVDSYWYNIFDYTKWLGKQFYCIYFCAEPLHLFQPIDIAHAGQSISINFEVKDPGKYISCLLFDKGNNLNEIDRRLELIGGSNKKGIAVPVYLRLVKDGRVYFEKKVDTAGSGGAKYINYKGDKVRVAERCVEAIELPAGSYTISFTALADNPLLNGIHAFVEMSYFKYQDKYFF